MSFSTAFTDVGFQDSHTATVNWGDGTALETATVSETNGSGTVADSHTYAANGTYYVTVVVRDDDNDTSQKTFRVQVGSDVIKVEEESIIEIDLTPISADVFLDNEIGFFIVQDNLGTIRKDATTTLVPGQAGYAQAALSHASRHVVLPKDRVDAFKAEVQAGPHAADAQVHRQGSGGPRSSPSTPSKAKPPNGG